MSSAIRGLRFDKVALRFVARLQRAIGGDVGGGTTVLFTLSAPIRLPARTAAELEARVRLWLQQGAAPDELRGEINGNQIRVRLAHCARPPTPNVLGFVHNPDVDTDAVLDAAQRSLRDEAEA